MTATYDCIATTTLGSNSTSVDFTSISGSYTDLIAVIAGSQTSTGVSINMRVNSDTGSNYSATILDGDGTSATSYKLSNNSQGMVIGALYGNASGQMNIVVQIQNYSNTTTYKTVLSRWAQANKGTEAIVGLWRSTSAITSLTFRSDGGTNNFATGTVFSLYGIKAE